MGLEFVDNQDWGLILVLFLQFLRQFQLYSTRQLTDGKHLHELEKTKDQWHNDGQGRSLTYHDAEAEAKTALVLMDR